MQYKKSFFLPWSQQSAVQHKSSSFKSRWCCEYLQLNVQQWQSAETANPAWEMSVTPLIFEINLKLDKKPEWYGHMMTSLSHISLLDLADVWHCSGAVSGLNTRLIELLLKCLARAPSGLFGMLIIWSFLTMEFLKTSQSSHLRTVSFAAAGWSRHIAPQFLEPIHENRVQGDEIRERDSSIVVANPDVQNEIVSESRDCVAGGGELYKIIKQNFCRGIFLSSAAFQPLSQLIFKIKNL